MARLEPLSQRQLLYELRFQIDRASAAESPLGDARIVAPAVAHIRGVLALHPKAMASIHLRHNLGVSRWDWLRRKGLVE